MMAVMREEVTLNPKRTETKRRSSDDVRTKGRPNTERKENGKEAETGRRTDGATSQERKWAGRQAGRGIGRYIGGPMMILHDA